MPLSHHHKLVLTPFGFGSLYSYELSGDYLVARLFGRIPIVRIHLAAILYFRLATREEKLAGWMLFKWVHLLPRLTTPYRLYVLQTRSRNRIFLKLDRTAHTRLSKAIARYSVQKTRLAA